MRRTGRLQGFKFPGVGEASACLSYPPAFLPVPFLLYIHSIQVIEHNMIQRASIGIDFVQDVLLEGFEISNN